MFRSVIITFFIITISLLCAEVHFYPTTFIAEDFGSTTCSNCLDAFAGLDVLHNSFHPGEFISARYFTSADLGNTETDARFTYYDVLLYPSVLFNGGNMIVGGGENVVNGSTYKNVILPKLFAASPLKMQLTEFNSATGQTRARVTMKSNDYALNNQTITFLLIENNVTANATHVVRSVLSQPISLSGLNVYQDVNATFTVLPAWNAANLWVAAFVQLDNHSIIQSCSSLPQPDYQVRVAMPFSPDIVDYPNINYASPSIGFFNTGLADNYTLRLLKDEGPDDWYLNYCGPVECYPGSIPHPFSLAAGDTTSFHLNLLIGAVGTCNFHFILESPNIDPYIIPFTYTATNTAADDQSLPVASLQLLQNYPNPVYENTTLRIMATKLTANAVIDVYNAKGQKVSTLNASGLKKGMNELNWKACDTNGKKLAQGVYYYRLNNATDTAIQKMLIINK